MQVSLKEHREVLRTTLEIIRMAMEKSNHITTKGANRN
jgi:hypothetical protein